MSSGDDLSRRVSLSRGRNWSEFTASNYQFAVLELWRVCRGRSLTVVNANSERWNVYVTIQSWGRASARMRASFNGFSNDPASLDTLSLCIIYIP